MVPAYVLTGLLFLVWLLQSTALAGRPPVNRLVAGLAVGLGTLALVICCPADREPGVSLPSSKRALRDWHGELPLGRWCAA
jgi:hypothetical protein